LTNEHNATTGNAIIAQAAAEEAGGGTGANAGPGASTSSGTGASGEGASEIPTNADGTIKSSGPMDVSIAPGSAGGGTDAQAVTPASSTPSTSSNDYQSDGGLVSRSSLPGAATSTDNPDTGTGLISRSSLPGADQSTDNPATGTGLVPRDSLPGAAPGPTDNTYQGSSSGGSAANGAGGDQSTGAPRSSGYADAVENGTMPATVPQASGIADQVENAPATTSNAGNVPAPSETANGASTSSNGGSSGLPEGWQTPAQAAQQASEILNKATANLNDVSNNNNAGAGLSPDAQTRAAQNAQMGQTGFSYDASTFNTFSTADRQNIVDAANGVQQGNDPHYLTDAWNSAVSNASGATQSSTGASANNNAPQGLSAGESESVSPATTYSAQVQAASNAGAAASMAALNNGATPTEAADAGNTKFNTTLSSLQAGITPTDEGTAIQGQSAGMALSTSPETQANALATSLSAQNANQSSTALSGQIEIAANAGGGAAQAANGGSAPGALPYNNSNPVVSTGGGNGGNLGPAGNSSPGVLPGIVSVTEGGNGGGPITTGPVVTEQNGGNTSTVPTGIVNGGGQGPTISNAPAGGNNGVTAPNLTFSGGTVTAPTGSSGGTPPTSITNPGASDNTAPIGGGGVAGGFGTSGITQPGAPINTGGQNNQGAGGGGNGTNVTGGSGGSSNVHSGNIVINDNGGTGGAPINGTNAPTAPTAPGAPSGGTGGTGGTGVNIQNPITNGGGANGTGGGVPTVPTANAGPGAGPVITTPTVSDGVATPGVSGGTNTNNTGNITLNGGVSASGIQTGGGTTVGATNGGASGNGSQTAGGTQINSSVGGGGTSTNGGAAGTTAQSGNGTTTNNPTAGTIANGGSSSTGDMSGGDAGAGNSSAGSTINGGVSGTGAVIGGGTQVGNPATTGQSANGAATGAGAQGGGTTTNNPTAGTLANGGVPPTAGGGAASANPPATGTTITGGVSATGAPTSGGTQVGNPPIAGTPPNGDVSGTGAPIGGGTQTGNPPTVGTSPNGGVSPTSGPTSGDATAINPPTVISGGVSATGAPIGGGTQTGNPGTSPNGGTPTGGQTGGDATTSNPPAGTTPSAGTPASGDQGGGGPVAGNPAPSGTTLNGGVSDTGVQTGGGAVTGNPQASGTSLNGGVSAAGTQTGGGTQVGTPPAGNNGDNNNSNPPQIALAAPGQGSSITGGAQTAQDQGNSTTANGNAQGDDSDQPEFNVPVLDKLRTRLIQSGYIIHDVHNQVRENLKNPANHQPYSVLIPATDATKGVAPFTVPGNAGKPFKTLEGAITDWAQQVRNVSAYHNLEYSTKFYRTIDGNYHYTTSYRGTVDESDPKLSASEVPEDGVPVASGHTHGGWEPSMIVPGVGNGSNMFSNADKAHGKRDNQLQVMLDPSGNIHAFDPAANRDATIGNVLTGVAKARFTLNGGNGTGKPDKIAPPQKATKLHGNVQTTGTAPKTNTQAKSQTGGAAGATSSSPPNTAQQNNGAATGTKINGGVSATGTKIGGTATGVGTAAGNNTNNNGANSTTLNGNNQVTAGNNQTQQQIASASPTTGAGQTQTAVSGSPASQNANGGATNAVNNALQGFASIGANVGAIVHGITASKEEKESAKFLNRTKNMAVGKYAQSIINLEGKIGVNITKKNLVPFLGPMGTGLAVALPLPANVPTNANCMGTAGILAGIQDPNLTANASVVFFNANYLKGQGFSLSAIKNVKPGDIVTISDSSGMTHAGVVSSSPDGTNNFLITQKSGPSDHQLTQQDFRSFLFAWTGSLDPESDKFTVQIWQPGPKANVKLTGGVNLAVQKTSNGNKSQTTTNNINRLQGNAKTIITTPAIGKQSGHISHFTSILPAPPANGGIAAADAGNPQTGNVDQTQGAGNFTTGSLPTLDISQSKFNPHSQVYKGRAAMINTHDSLLTQQFKAPRTPHMDYVLPPDLNHLLKKYYTGQIVQAEPGVSENAVQEAKAAVMRSSLNELHYDSQHIRVVAVDSIKHLDAEAAEEEPRGHNADNTPAELRVKYKHLDGVTVGPISAVAENKEEGKPIILNGNAALSTAMVPSGRVGANTGHEKGHALMNAMGNFDVTNKEYLDTYKKLRASVLDSLDKNVEAAKAQNNPQLLKQAVDYRDYVLNNGDKGGIGYFLQGAKVPRTDNNGKVLPLKPTEMERKLLNGQIVREDVTGGLSESAAELANEINGGTSNGGPQKDLIDKYLGPLKGVIRDQLKKIGQWNDEAPSGAPLKGNTAVNVSKSLQLAGNAKGAAPAPPPVNQGLKQAAAQVTQTNTSAKTTAQPETELQKLTESVKILDTQLNAPLPPGTWEPPHRILRGVLKTAVIQPFTFLATINAAGKDTSNNRLQGYANVIGKMGGDAYNNSSKTMGELGNMTGYVIKNEQGNLLEHLAKNTAEAGDIVSQSATDYYNKMSEGQKYDLFGQVLGYALPFLLPRTPKYDGAQMRVLPKAAGLGNGLKVVKGGVAAGAMNKAAAGALKGAAEEDTLAAAANEAAADTTSGKSGQVPADRQAALKAAAQATQEKEIDAALKYMEENNPELYKQLIEDTPQLKGSAQTFNKLDRGYLDRGQESNVFFQKGNKLKSSDVKNIVRNSKLESQLAKQDLFGKNLDQFSLYALKFVKKGEPNVRVLKFQNNFAAEKTWNQLWGSRPFDAKIFKVVPLENNRFLYWQEALTRLTPDDRNLVDAFFDNPQFKLYMEQNNLRFSDDMIRTTGWRQLGKDKKGVVKLLDPGAIKPNAGPPPEGSVIHKGGVVEIHEPPVQNSSNPLADLKRQLEEHNRLNQAPVKGDPDALAADESSKLSNSAKGYSTADGKKAIQNINDALKFKGKASAKWNVEDANYQLKDNTPTENGSVKTNSERVLEAGARASARAADEAAADRVQALNGFLFTSDNVKASGSVLGDVQPVHEGILDAFRRIPNKYIQLAKDAGHEHYFYFGHTAEDILPDIGERSMTAQGITAWVPPGWKVGQARWAAGEPTLGNTSTWRQIVIIPAYRKLDGVLVLNSRVRETVLHEFIGHWGDFKNEGGWFTDTPEFLDAYNRDVDALNAMALTNPEADNARDIMRYIMPRDGEAKAHVGPREAYAELMAFLHGGSASGGPAADAIFRQYFSNTLRVIGAHRVAGGW
jgi:hypothetical protein